MYNFKNMYVRSDIGEKIIRNYTIKKQKNMDRREREERVKQFKSNMGFKEDIMYLNKENSIEIIIKTIFSNEIISLQHSVLSYEIDIYFVEHKLAIDIDKLGNTDRDISFEKMRENEIKEKLDCKFIRINPDKEKLNVLIEISKIQNHIINSIKEKTKKSTIDEVKKLLNRESSEKK